MFVRKEKKHKRKCQGLQSHSSPKKYTSRQSVRGPFRAPEIDFNLMKVATNTAGYFRLRFKEI